HENPGLFQDPEWKMRTQKARWFPAETVSVAIGQAMTVTPVQLARLTAAVANGGRLVTPHPMKTVAGEAVPLPATQETGRRPDVLATVRDAMTGVVRGGAGSRARLGGVGVA